MKAADRADFLARSVPTSAKGIIERAFAGKASPRAAIKAKCLDCSGYDRSEVADCLVILCPLHSYRPFQKNARKGSENAPGSESCDLTGQAGVQAASGSPKPSSPPRASPRARPNLGDEQGE